MTNLEKMKAEIQQMSIMEFIHLVTICDRIDRDIKEKYCRNHCECIECQKDWLNREVKEDTA